MFNSPLPQSNLAIMKALACYRFLTVAQMVRLNIAKSQPNTYTALAKFKKSKLTKKANHRFYVGMVEAFYFGVGFPSLYFLTKKGAVYLSDYEGMEFKNIQYFKGNPSLSTVSLKHKISLVDFHISLRELIAPEKKDPYVPKKLHFFDTYLESEGSNASKKGDMRTVKTQIFLWSLYRKKKKEEYIIPDAIFDLELGNGYSSLFTLEIDRTKNTKRCVEQIHKHIYASGNKDISEHYDQEEKKRLNFILYVFENKQMEQLVRKNFMKNHPDEKDFFEMAFISTTTERVSNNLLEVFKEAVKRSN